MSNQNNNSAKIATIGRKVESENIDHLLDKFFEIPAYQRLYEWESIQIEELLNDMKKAWKPDILQGSESNTASKQYFIGNITTSKEIKNEQEKFILIDGQQRLTTLWFIGFYLASKGCKIWKNFISQDDKLRIAMPIRDNEEKSLKDIAMKIQNNTIKPNENSEINLYTYLPSDIHQKIINAFECIEKWFNAMFGKYANGKLEIDLKQLKCFSLFIYIRVCFVFVELAENTDLNRFFVRMNNRGKQLEKHEILKARMLGEIRKKYDENGKLIKDTNDTIWEKYAKIWDLCSDMNKYIFQSASDRKVLNSANGDNEKWNIDKIVREFNDKNTKSTESNDTLDKVQSIIDFSTFLLHCYKLWVAKKCSGKIDKITIAKDKLLEVMWDNQTYNGKNKEVILDNKFIFNDKNDENGQAKENCKEFIIDMLHYRVLFDYFVIKSDVVAKGGDSYKIMRLSENKGNYSLPENSKKGELTSGVLHDLVMIQNYLRVARQGERQNYHHWLTPFLAYLDSEEICKQIWKDYICKDNFKKIDEIAGLFKTDTENKKAKTPNEQKPYNETNMINFLENLDTKLATYQLGASVENKLIETTNNVLKDLNVNLSNGEQELINRFKELAKWDFLNNGTGTPHYWFYRLEYYLWKWGKDSNIKLGELENKFGIKIYNAKLGEGKDETKFSDIFTKNLFHFRMLGSIEHFSARQRGRKQEKWDNLDNLDIFGNLALISQNFNSSLSNHLEQFKKDEVIKQLKRGRLESLKYFIMCANLNGDEWTYENAQEHQEQMINILIESLKKS